MSRLIAEVTEVLSPVVGLALTGPQWVRFRVRVTGAEQGPGPIPSGVEGLEGTAERVVRFDWELRVGKRVVLSREESRQFLPAAGVAPVVEAPAARRHAAQPYRGAPLPHPPRWGVSRQARGS
jgi:hypothetical protein